LHPITDTHPPTHPTYPTYPTYPLPHLPHLPSTPTPILPQKETLIMTTPKRIGILTSGGDCPGLNAVIRAVVKCADRRGWDVIGIP